MPSYLFAIVSASSIMILNLASSIMILNLASKSKFWCHDNTTRDGGIEMDRERGGVMEMKGKGRGGIKKKRLTGNERKEKVRVEGGKIVHEPRKLP